MNPESCIMDQLRKMMRTMKRIAGYLSLAVFVMFSLSACAEKGPILLAIGYQSPEKTTPTASSISIGVNPLKDGRGKPALFLGKKTLQDGSQNDFVVKDTASETATRALKEALVARGFTVQDVAGWDLTAEGMPPCENALLLGGEIITLWLESVSAPFKTSMQAVVQIRIIAGDCAEKKIIRSLTVSSRVDHDVFYSPEKPAALLSEALTSAIDQIFKDAELKKRLP